MAIYFNKNGFNKNIESTLNADLDRQQITDAADRLNAKKDIVTIAPTGKSDRLYNYHDGAGYHQLGRAVDTYELSVLLPSIGTSISEMWNVVYGKGTSRDSKGRLLWDKTTGLFATEENNQVDPKNALRNTNILWNNINGTRLIYPNGNGSFTYNPESIDNLVTGINTIHDLVGQIIIEVDPAEHLNEEYTLNHVEDWDPTKIYYIKNGNEGKFYIKEKDYTYQESNVIYKRATNVVNSLDGYYRQEIHEFPTFDDETLKSSENEEKETLSKKVYIDYKKASNDGKFIDGAIYYTIDDPNLNDAVKLILPDDIADSSQELYQKDGVNYNKVLDLESSDSKNGQFYKLTTTQIPTSQESPYEFYVPGRYYFATATTEDNLDEGIYSKIIQGNEETLNGAFVAAGQPQFYHIFRNITTIENTSGGFVEDIDSPIIRKNVPFPENSINYTEDLQRGKLILKTDEGETICEIPADRNESVDFENKTYSAYTYKIEPIIGQSKKFIKIIISLSKKMVIQ